MTLERLFPFSPSGSLLNAFTPADGNASKSPFEFGCFFCDVSKTLLDLHSTVGWKEAKRTNEPRVPSPLCLPFTLSSLLPLCQRLLLIYSLLPLLSCWCFLSSDNPIQSDLLLSRGNEPLFPTFPNHPSPSSRPFAAASFLLALLCSLCPGLLPSSPVLSGLGAALRVHLLPAAAHPPQLHHRFSTFVRRPSRRSSRK